MARSLILTVLLALVFSHNASANPSCTCSMDYTDDQGVVSTESSSVTCPDAENSYDLNCEGDELVGEVTSTCTNSTNGQSTSETSFPRNQGNKKSPWASCDLF